MGLSQGRNVHPSTGGHPRFRSTVLSSDLVSKGRLGLFHHLSIPQNSVPDPVTQDRVGSWSSLHSKTSTLCPPRSMPALAARHLCLMALQRGHLHCPHTAPASRHQDLSKSTAQLALARAPSGSHRQTSTQALALKRAQQAAPGASSRAAMCLSTHTSGISRRTSSLRPRPPWPSMDTLLRPQRHWRPSRRSLWMLGKPRPSSLASQQRPGAMGFPTPARNTAPKSW